MLNERLTTIGLYGVPTIATDALRYWLSQGELKANIILNEGLPSPADEFVDVRLILQSPARGLPKPAEIISAFKKCGSRPTIVIVAPAFTAATQHYVEAGIQGLLPYTTRLPVLSHAIRLVTAGGRFVAQELLDAQWNGAGALATRAPAHLRGDLQLTTRERQVLMLVRQGQSNKQIAAALEIAETTAKLHVRRLMQKLNVENRTQAALVAGLIEST